MSEKGQLIFKIIVWIILFICIGFIIFEKVDSVDNPIISQTEWNAMLTESFGDNALLTLKNSEEPVTREYAAITSMMALGENRLKYLTGKSEFSDSDLKKLAIKNSIVSSFNLKDTLSQKEANEIIVKALSLYFSPDYYPEYCEIETKVNIIDASLWEIVSYDKQNEILTAKLDFVPQQGQVITLTNEFGVMEAREIKEVTSKSNNTYVLQLNEIADISQIIESISFSGYSDFSYLASMSNNNSTNNSRTKEEYVFETYTPGRPLLLSSNIPGIQVAEWELSDGKLIITKDKAKDCKTSDIEISAKIVENTKDGKSVTEGVVYIKVSAGKESSIYKYTIDTEGNEKLELTNEYVEVEISKEEVKETSKNDSKKPASNSGFKDTTTVAANIQIEDFSVCSSAYFEGSYDLFNGVDVSSPNNYAEVLVGAKKVEISSKVQVATEDKYKIGSFPIPIASTVGAASVNLNLYLVITSNGEVTLWYEIEDPYVGATISVTNGLDLPHGHSSEDAGIKAKFEVGGGFIGEAALVVFNKYVLANPSVDVRAYASAGTIDVPEQYEVLEEYKGTSCLELKAQAPTISISPSSGPDSLCAKVLELKGIETTYVIIEKDSEMIPFKVVCHLEEDKYGNLTFYILDAEESHEDLCTHIKVREPVVDDDGNIIINYKDQIEEEKERKRKELQEQIRKEFEAAIEKALEEFMLENCEGCY